LNQPNDSIVNIPGIRVGQVSDFEHFTGCTVILCPEGTVGGVDIRGSASGTRQLDALRPEHAVPFINALCLAGGSAFGLDAGGGVQAWLEDQGVGYDVTVTRVPIVPTAILFDLAFGSKDRRPDRAMGYEACRQATNRLVEMGSVGAGTGATVGKLFGVAQATKGGVGSACRKGPTDLLVGALAVVNAFGDVLDDRGQIMAGARTSGQAKEFVNTAAAYKKGITRKRFLFQSTTLGVVVTNAALSKNEAAKVAGWGQNALACVIHPTHTLFDGDIVFTLATGQVQADLHLIGILAQEALKEAIWRGIRQADGFGLLPAHRDL
jgi:L-aminopeptidase/D-esterase-like protein